MISNLPTTQSSATNLKKFFNNTLTKEISYPAAAIDATVAFFLKRGFDKTSANSIAIILLNQAKAENVQVFTLIDTLKGLTDIQLSQVVAQVMNASRDKTSQLGYRTATVTNTYEARNILV